MPESPPQILPLVYDNTTKVTQLAERRELQTWSTTAINQHFRRFAEQYSVNNMQAESTLFMAVQYLLTHLTLPNETQPNPQAGGPVGNMPGGNMPVGQVGTSPNPQMMQQMGVPPQQVGPVPGPGM